MIHFLLKPFLMIKHALWIVIWHVVYFFLCRPKLLIVTLIAATAGLIWFFTHYNVAELLKFDKPAEKSVPVIVKLPELKHKPKDGNSHFAKNLFAELDEDSKNFYGQHYQYAMAYIKDNETYKWKANEVFFGKLTLAKTFKSPKGHTCRYFKELIHTNSGSQYYKGTGCEVPGGQGSWCRLPRKATPNCNISFTPSGNFLNSIKNWF